ncbi:unnamed protein product [Rhodiola kirilowii]
MNHVGHSRDNKNISLRTRVFGDLADCTSYQLALMTRKFGRMIRKLNKRRPEQGQSPSSKFGYWTTDTKTSRNRNVCMVAFSSSSHMEKDRWYFDSGCSAHMTGKGQVIDCGTLKVPDLPVLKDTLLVEGLKVNLISISQLCDAGYHVTFTHNSCQVLDKEGGTLMKGSRAANNCYLIGSAGTVAASACLSSQADEMALWHRRLGHLNLKTLKKFCSTGLIRGMPNIKGDLDVICGECQVRKQTKTSHPNISQIFTNRPLELIHMDLMGPIQVESYGGKKYVLVCVDDFTRYTWTRFLRDKTEAAQQFIELFTLIQQEREDKGERLVSSRSDNGTEFKNGTMATYCAEHKIAHQFASAITPQQNGVVEQKNHTI